MNDAVNVLLAEIQTLLRSEGRHAADETADFLSAGAALQLGPNSQQLSFEYDLRRLLQASPLKVAAAMLNAWDHIPWGNNPVSVGPKQAIFAVSSLLGDNAAIYAPDHRLGFFYQSPHSYYGLHDHLADETYTILAGAAHWTAGDTTLWRRPGDMIHHPSMTPHAFRTGREGFVAMWRWSGDVSTDSYRMMDDPLVA